MNARRRVASLFLGVVLAACGGASATPVPAGPTPPPPSTTPIASPGPTSVASAAATPPVPSPSAAATGLAAGWHHELVCREDGTGCQLHLHDAPGRDQPGWPVTLPGGCWSENLAVARDGVAYAACKVGDQVTVVSAFAVTGSARPGWPVQVAGYPEEVRIGPNGTLYLGTSGTGYSVHALAPDGQPRPGWPLKLPGAGQRFALAPDGTVVGWWYEDVKEGTLDLQAARTKFTMIGPNGRTLPGLWPTTSIGTATAPVIAPDGRIFYTSATAKVWGHDRSGNIVDGWPYQLRDKVAPELRPDGLLLFIVGGWTSDDGSRSDSEITALTTGGRVAEGWPYRTSSSLDGVQCVTDAPAYYPHAMSADGTLYLAPWTRDRAEVVALDGRGRVVSGWPYGLPAGSRVASIEMRPGGQIVVTLRPCSPQGEGCCNPDATRQVILAPTGELAS